MEEKKISLTDLEKIAEEVHKKYAYPKYIGNGLYKVAPNCICGEKMMEEISKIITED